MDRDGHRISRWLNSWNFCPRSRCSFLVVNQVSSVLKRPHRWQQILVQIPIPHRTMSTETSLSRLPSWQSYRQTIPSRHLSWILFPPARISPLTKTPSPEKRPGYFPSAWKLATVAIVPKPSKNHFNSSSCRPFSLLNVIGKAYERIFVDRLTQFSMNGNKISDHQFGFRPGRSTSLPSDVRRALNSGRCVMASFLDIERAFGKACYWSSWIQKSPPNSSDSLTVFSPTGNTESA